MGIEEGPDTGASGDERPCGFERALSAARQSETHERAGGSERPDVRGISLAKGVGSWRRKIAARAAKNDDFERMWHFTVGGVAREVAREKRENGANGERAERKRGEIRLEVNQIWNQECSPPFARERERGRGELNGRGRNEGPSGLGFQTEHLMLLNHGITIQGYDMIHG